MVKDTLKNYKDYCVPGSLLEKGFKYLQEKASPDLADGKYEIEGSDCFALVQSYTTVPSNEKKWESHKLYLDIQYIVAGSEICAYIPADELKVADDQTPKADLVFYHDAQGTDLKLNAGEFALLYPQDGHKPGVILNSAGPVKKIVVKVKCR
ncbi:MAG: YhcH/YjgK/YiaL family protein [Fibrobacteres bacterium]|nr:YhcH/YjgK/YiaL family protein [Fibrobacterota bacterium]